MKNKKFVSFCFLILHYMDADLTCKTVESVLNLVDFCDSQIIIVDNASPNGSGKLLKEKYNEIDYIHMVLSSENVGFSAGNNLGFRYIKDNFLTDFIVVINNDILFPQKNFISKVKELYKEDPFWVAGPDIFQPHKNYHSSPEADKWRTEKEIKLLVKEIEWEKEKLKKNFSICGLKLYLKDCYAKSMIVRLIIKLNRYMQGQKKAYDKRGINVVLQGSCLIFDKRYCEKNEELFLPLTFMYAEEEILTWNCKKNNWEIKYFPEIQVWHENHGSSQLSGMAYRQYCDKKILGMNQVIKAHKAYLKLLDSENQQHKYKPD